MLHHVCYRNPFCSNKFPPGGRGGARRAASPGDRGTANLRTSTKILDLGGFDSSGILILRGGILRPIGNLPEVLSQRILVGRFLVGRLGVGWGYRCVCVCEKSVPPKKRDPWADRLSEHRARGRRAVSAGTRLAQDTLSYL